MNMMIDTINCCCCCFKNNKEGKKQTNTYNNINLLYFRIAKQLLKCFGLILEIIFLA